MFFLSGVHFITSKVDSSEVVGSDPNDDVIHPYLKEARAGYASKNIRLFLHVNAKIIDYKATRLLFKIDLSMYPC